MAQNLIPEVATPELKREQVVTTLIQPLSQQSAILGMPGVRIFDLQAGYSGPIRVPKLMDDKQDPSPHELDDTATAVSLWRGESELIGEEEEDFDQVSLLPPDMKSVKVIWRTSNELARWAFVSITNVAQQDMVRKCRRAVDRQFINGTGDGVTMPKGLLQPGHGFEETTTEWTDSDHVYDVVDVALENDVTSLGWLMYPTTLTATRRWKGTDGHPLLATDPQEAMTPRLAGYPVRTSTLWPKDKIMFGDMSTIAIGRDLDARVTALPERFAEFDQWACRIVLRMDCKPLLPEAIVVATVTPAVP